MNFVVAGAMRIDHGLIEPTRWRHWRHFHWRRYHYWRGRAAFQRSPLADLPDHDPEPGRYRAHEWVDPPSGVEPSPHE